MNESSRQASLPTALPGNYGPPQPVGPGPGGHDPWLPGSAYATMLGSSEFDSMRAGLFSSGGFNAAQHPPPPHQGFLNHEPPPHLFNKMGVHPPPHFAPPSSPYLSAPYANTFNKGDGIPQRLSSNNTLDNNQAANQEGAAPPPEGLSARLLDKSPTSLSSSHENVTTPPVPSREGTPAGNVGYRPWEQPGAQEGGQPPLSAALPQDNAQLQRSPSAQQDKQGSGSATPGSRDSRSGTPFRSQDYLPQSQLSDHGSSMDRTATPNRPPSHMSSGPSPESHQDSQESMEGEGEKLQRLTPHTQSSMCPPPPGPMSMSSAPHRGGTIQFGQMPPGHPHYMQGQTFPTSPGSQRFFPDPKRLKIEADSSTADYRGPMENSFQVPSISSTTSRQQALSLPPMHHPPVDQWDSGNIPQNPGIPSNPDLDKAPKKKRKRCGECPGCMKKDNCGECGPCKSVRSHQICKMRKCDQLKTKKERMASGYAPPEYTPPKQVRPAPSTVYEPPPQYNFPPQQVLAFNGHMDSSIQPRSNHIADEEDYAPAPHPVKHKMMNSRLKTLIQTRQNQKELQSIQQVDSYPPNQIYSHQTMPPGPLSGHMHEQQPYPDQLPDELKNRSPTTGGGGDMNMMWSDLSSSPLQKTKDDIHSGTGHFDKNNHINNDKAYSRGNADVPNTNEQLGFLGGLENQRDSNGINYGSFYEQSSTKENTNLDQNQRSENDPNVMFASNNPPKYQSRSDGINSEFFHIPSNQQNLPPPPSSPYALPSSNNSNINNSNINSSPIFSPQSHSPLEQEQIPPNYSNNANNSSSDTSSETRSSDATGTAPSNSNNSANNNDANSSSARNETNPTTNNVAETSNEESSENGSFLLNTTTSMNTFTSIINSYNLAPFTSSPFLSTLPSVSSLFGSGHHPVIASSAGQELKTSHSLYTSSLTGGAPLIDSGRIEDSSSSSDFFSLPPSLSSNKHASSSSPLINPLLSSDLSSPFVLPLPTMNNWWEHYDRLKPNTPKHEVPLDAPAASSESDAFSNNGTSEFQCNPPPNATQDAPL